MTIEDQIHQRAVTLCADLDELALCLALGLEETLMDAKIGDTRMPTVTVVTKAECELMHRLAVEIINVLRGEPS